MSRIDPPSVPDHVGNATEVLDHLARSGYGVSLRPGPDPGTMRCSACRRVSAVADFDSVWATRLEGTSDPDDMVLIVAAECPVCEQGGNIVLGFGPTASGEDSAIVAEIPDDVMRHHAPEQPSN